jgi:hypothetical protein
MVVVLFYFRSFGVKSAHVACNVSIVNCIKICNFSSENVLFESMSSSFESEVLENLRNLSLTSVDFQLGAQPCDRMQIISNNLWIIEVNELFLKVNKRQKLLS